jgi:hypothetical protein
METLKKHWYWFALAALVLAAAVWYFFFRKLAANTTEEEVGTEDAPVIPQNNKLGLKPGDDLDQAVRDALIRMENRTIYDDYFQRYSPGMPIPLGFVVIDGYLVPEVQARKPIKTPINIDDQKVRGGAAVPAGGGGVRNNGRTGAN